jgi:hypothetical protein
MKIEKKIIKDIDIDEKSFKEIIQKNYYEKNPIFEEYQIHSYSIPEYESIINNYQQSDIDGHKIVLKKNKIKFIGIKAKILKKYKDISKNSMIGSNKLIQSNDNEIICEDEII